MNIEFSRELYKEAVAKYDPYAVVLMLSGGNDSVALYEVIKELGIKLDFVCHGVTGTGIPQTREFVHQIVSTKGDRLIEADAGNTYEKYVLRKGFFGRGNTAHSYAYHLLKADGFKKAMSKHIRKGKRNRKILLLNGVRSSESHRRKFGIVEPIRVQPGAKSNIWVNLIHTWSKQDVENYLEGSGCKINPVTKNLCRSGECMCGTMQKKGDRIEAEYYYPKWGEWLNGLRKAVKEKGFTWDWAEEPHEEKKREWKGQLNMFQPMCTGCKNQFGKSLNTTN